MDWVSFDEKDDEKESKVPVYIYASCKSIGFLLHAFAYVFKPPLYGSKRFKLKKSVCSMYVHKYVYFPANNFARK